MPKSKIQSNPSVDAFGKATISLGAHCPLKCAHCYTATPSFHVDEKRSVDRALEEVEQLGSPKIICLSGDTDPLLRPAAAVEFLFRAADQFPSSDLMFTTRLVPDRSIENELMALGESLADVGRFLVGAVSLVSPEFPNRIEHPRLVAPSRDRQGFLSRLSTGRQPVILALRPTFPFSVVSRDQVDRMIFDAQNSADVVLGEVLLLDEDEVIASRLGIPARLKTDEIGEMTFLNQPVTWRKRKLIDESTYADAVATKARLPYFLRSVSAMRYFAQYWDLKQGHSKYRHGDPLNMDAEEVSP